MEVFQRVLFFADADQLDRGAGDGAHRQRGAATGVAVHAGEYDAGDGEGIVKRLGGVDCVLAGHGIDDEQGFCRVGGGAHLADFVHQLLIDGQAAGGVEDDDVEAFAAADIHGAIGDLHRGLTGDDRQAGNTGLVSKLGKLELRGGALRVEAGEQDSPLQPVLEPAGEFPRCRGLSGALQADHQDRHRGGGVEVERHRAFAAQRLDHHVVDDFYDLLAGGDRIQHLGADGAFTHLGDEVANDRQGDVGIEQREADFAQGFGDVGLVQRSAGAEPVENA